MDKKLLKVALRAGALYLKSDRQELEPVEKQTPNLLHKSTIFCLQELLLHGFILDERALHAFNRLVPEDKAEVLDVIQDLMGTNLNWTPLVRGWREPTNENYADHLLTAFYNVFVSLGNVSTNSTQLPCGHYIPEGTFDLSRYTGCPFCGKPFETSDFVYKGQGSKLKVLKYWTDKDVEKHYLNLLQSSVPLSESQVQSLIDLLEIRPLPTVDIPMRETLIIVLDALKDSGRYEDMVSLFASPADVLRYIWYLTTGQLQVIKPKTMLRLDLNNRRPSLSPYSNSAAFVEFKKKEALRLKFDRPFCRMAAKAFCSFNMSAAKACEIMNPKRGMWVRAIRALRLAEYAKKPGYEKLREILDRFYRKDYTVAQGQVDAAFEADDYDTAVKVLKAHPGMFARELFSTMLRFNPYSVLADFKEVIDQLPLRLVFSLENNAEAYFNNLTGQRVVRDLLGQVNRLPVNPRLDSFYEEERQDLVKAVRELSLVALSKRYALNPCPGQKIYIAPELYDVILPVGDRAKVSSADFMNVPPGTRFDVQGDEIRLFLNWGKGLKAQHIDLDLSAALIYEDKTEVCSYFSLVVPGAKHSGDIRQIPDYVGTAEYINLDIPALRKQKVKFVAFTANCYSSGALTANAMVGWMDSKFPMAVSDEKGVAYDPSCVQYMVKVPDTMLSEGLVFGVLDVVKNQVVWLEMPFSGRTVESLDVVAVRGYLHRLKSKVTIGKALETMAKARGMEIVGRREDIDPDTQVYDQSWAYDIPAVTALLIPND